MIVTHSAAGPMLTPAIRPERKHQGRGQATPGGNSRGGQNRHRGSHAAGDAPAGQRKRRPRKRNRQVSGNVR